jgi:hypothetical protein
MAVSVGRPDRLAREVSRRQFLHAAGALSVAAVFPEWAPGSARSSKCLIHIHLPGGPSHLDTFDLKPLAPREIRGEFQPIATNVDGIQICELLPRLAKLADRFSIVRSITGLPDRHSAEACGWDSTGEFTVRSISRSADNPLLFRAITDRMRASYGADECEENNTFIAARRLIDAGASYVPFSWGYWDTHGNNFGQLRKQLPRLDAGLSALIRDLDHAGRLDEVVILMCGEFGRTPTINNGAGRDHWTHASFAFIAGGGLRHGQVIGATDRRGEFPAERPLRMDDVLTTIRAAVGVDGLKLSQDKPIRELLC